MAKPKIRFKGYTDDWEQRKFGDDNDLITGYPFESEKFSEEGIKLVRGMNVKRGYLDFSNDICMRWNSTDGLENYLLEADDILIQMDGALIGKSYAKIAEEQLPALLVQRVTRARTRSKDACTDFMYQTIQRDFLRYIGMNKTETAVPHLSLNDIYNFKIMVPCLEEQQQIGAYFSNIDNLITLHQRKCEETKKLKKYMLQKMFPKNGQTVPEIRFAGFTDAWEQRKLGDLVDRVTRKNQDLVSELPLTISAQYGLIDQNEFFEKRVASKDVSGYYLIENGEFAYNKSTSTDAPWGAVKRLDRYENGVLSTLYIVFGIKENNPVDSDFLVSYYSTNLWHKGIHEIAAEGARNHGLLNIAPADFFETELTIPQDIEEQKKIGKYFEELERLITLHQHKCEQLQSMKKFMLQNMFV